jgi:MFS family permease
VRDRFVACLTRAFPAASARFGGFSPEVQHALRIDISVMVLMTLFTGLTQPFTGLILRRELGASPLQLSILGSANAACLLLSLALTRLIDSRRPLPWVVWPGFMARGLFLLVPFIHSPWPFVGVLVGATALGTIVTPAQTALVEQLYPKPERGRALGTVRVAGALLGIGLALAAGYIMGWLSYRWVFAGAGLLGMLASLRQRRLPVHDDAPTDRVGDRPTLREAWYALRDDDRFRNLMAGTFVFGSGVWLMQPATPIVLADIVRASTAQVGVFASLGAVAALAGNVLWGRLVDGRSSFVALRTVYTVGTLTPLIYLFAKSSWVVALASVSESLLATGLDLVMMLVIIDAAGPRKTAQYAAISATLAGVRGVIGPLAGGALITSIGVHAVYLVATMLMAGGALLVQREICRSHHHTRRYIAQPRQTSGARSLVSAARNA